MTKIIDGKKVSQLIKEELTNIVKDMTIKPHLAVIKVGDDSASEIYVNAKRKDALEIGIDFTKIELPDNISEELLLTEINNLNENNSISGIIVQLPLPKHLNERKILNSIDFNKDVDGLSLSSIGALYADEDTNIPCTAMAVIKLLHHYSLEINGKNVVIVGRSNLVGKPLSALMLKENATVTVCHSKTKNLIEYTKNADILISAVGKKNLINFSMVKENVIIIDVGITRDNGKIYGDVDFDNVYYKCSYITPVPGGVGPMTRVMLLENVVKNVKR